MKTVKIALLFAFLLGVQSVYSQVNLGLKVGANYNFNGYQSDSLNLNLDNATSFSGGAFLRIKVKKLSIQGEGLLAHRKGAYEKNGLSSKIDFYAFDVPILLGYKLIDLKVVKLRVNAGVIPSFTITKTDDLGELDYKDAFYSAAAGVTLDIPLFMFDLRYQGGIVDYSSLKGINSNTTLNNSLVTLSVGWKII